MSKIEELWIEAAFTAEYERDTLPLLFASDRIFVEYYDALAQKNRSLHSAIEQIRDENAAARNYRVEGMWRESIEALMRCVELRRAVFDAADFQFLAALRHGILSMLNFASYFMKEASGGAGSSSTAAAENGGGGGDQSRQHQHHHHHSNANNKSSAPDAAATMLSRAFELLKRAEEACAKFGETTTDRAFFRAVVENNFALYFMKKKLYKAAAQRLQLAAKAWQVVAPRGDSAVTGGSSEALGGGADSSRGTGSDVAAVNFYFAVQRGVGECSCERYESALELFKRAVAMAPQLPEEQDQQRADADRHDEDVAAGKAPAAGSSSSAAAAAAPAPAVGSGAAAARPTAVSRGSSYSDGRDSDADDLAHSASADPATDGAGAAAAAGSSYASGGDAAAAAAAGKKTNNKGRVGGAVNKKTPGAVHHQQQQHGPLPVHVALQLLGVGVSVMEVTQIALHYNIGVAFVGLRRYREALPWCTKASEQINACRGAFPANCPIVKIITTGAEYCHKTNSERGHIDYRMKRSEYHQTAHLKKFRSLHSAIKPNAGATAFERRRRALHNSYQEKHGGGDEADEEGNKSSKIDSSGSRARSATGNNSSANRSVPKTRGVAAPAAAAAAGAVKQSSEALRQYLRSLTYEQLVAEFGPDGKRRVASSSGTKPRKVTETSPRLLKIPDHKLRKVEHKDEDTTNKEQ